MTKVRLAIAIMALTQAMAVGAEAQGGPPKWSVGAAGIYSSTPFEAESDEVNAFPYIAYRGERFFFEGRALGFHLLQPDEASDEGFFLDLLASARMLPGSSRDKVTVDAGVRGGLSGPFGTLSITALHDVTGTSGGKELQLDYSYGFTSGKLRFTPRVGLSWQDRDLANYLWGTTADQQARMIEKGKDVILPVYQPAMSVLNIEAGALAVYDLTNSVSMIAFTSATHLDKAIRANPGIDKKVQFSFGLGLAYNF